MQVTNSHPPVSAAAAAATRHTADFTALGATQVLATNDGGLSVEFADLDAARMAKALVNDAIPTDFGGATVRVPVTIVGADERPSVAVEDAARAIGKLSGVWKTDTGRRGITATVMGDAATARLDALLRDEVCGVKVRLDTVQIGAHDGWGGGF